MSDTSLFDWDQPRLLPHHRQEWLNSGVTSEIIEANVQSLSGEDAIQTILYAFLDKQGAHAKHYVTTALDKQLNHYDAIVNGQGGWRVAGLDPLNHWTRMEWGRFKPDEPRVEIKDGKQKPIKYESPLKTPTRATFLALPDRPDFWQQVLDMNATIYLTEGEKKAGCLLSLGYPAIALPGIWNGCPKDHLSIPHLIPELEHFATSGRSVVIVFDQDEKATTRASVAEAQFRLGTLLKIKGCTVTATSWDMALGKGIDDVCMAQGSDCIHAILQSTIPIRDASIQPETTMTNYTLELRHLICENAQAILNGEKTLHAPAKFDLNDQEFSLFRFIQDVNGCNNWAQKQGFAVIGSPSELTREAAQILKLDSERASGIEQKVGRLDRQKPSSVVKERAETSIWMKAARLNFEGFDKLCPDAIKPTVLERLEEYGSTQGTQAEQNASSSAAPYIPSPEKRDQFSEQFVHRDISATQQAPDVTNPPPLINVVAERDAPEKESEPTQDYWNRRLATVGRELLPLADVEVLDVGCKFEFDAESRNTDAQYVVVFNETTNTMRIYGKHRGEDWENNPILVDANGKIAAESSATKEDVKAFEAARDQLRQSQKTPIALER